MVPRVRAGEGGDEVKRYNLGWQYDPDPFVDRRCEPERQLVEARNGEWCRASEVDAALSARDARIASLELDYAVALTTLAERDARIAELERHLAACKAELRARREYADACNGERFISEQAWEHARKKIDELRAATDAAGGVA
jgi:uncharacterized coiled-coil protein SlyX